MKSNKFYLDYIKFSILNKKNILQLNTETGSNQLYFSKFKFEKSKGHQIYTMLFFAGLEKWILQNKVHEIQQLVSKSQEILQGKLQKIVESLNSKQDYQTSDDLLTDTLEIAFEEFQNVSNFHEEIFELLNRMSTTQQSNSRFNRIENLKNEIHNTLVAGQVFDKCIKIITEEQGLDVQYSDYQNINELVDKVVIIYENQNQRYYSSAHLLNEIGLFQQFHNLKSQNLYNSSTTINLDNSKISDDNFDIKENNSIVNQYEQIDPLPSVQVQIPWTILQKQDQQTEIKINNIDEKDQKQDSALVIVKQRERPVQPGSIHNQDSFFDQAAPSPYVSENNKQTHFYDTNPLINKQINQIDIPILNTYPPFNNNQNESPIMNQTPPNYNNNQEQSKKIPKKILYQFK